MMKNAKNEEIKKFVIDPKARIGWVHLTVSDLEKSLDFYINLLGFYKLKELNKTAFLGIDGKTLIILTEHKGAKPKPYRTRGLYHYAILLPTRKDLARILVRLLNYEYYIEGFADHVATEAIYLADNNGHGIEIYWDRPREKWKFVNGKLYMATLPLDIENLIEEIKEEKFKIALSNEWRIPSNTRIGHIHLHVSNLKIMEEFYTKALGFDLTLRYMGSASFLAAGGYHHHIGMNIWAGLNAPPVPEDCVKLISYSIILSSKENLKELTNNLVNLNVNFKEDLGEYAELIQEGISVKDPDGNLIIIGLEKFN